jgi:hypothetical protein
MLQIDTLASLEGMTVHRAEDVTFENELFMDGDIVINASGTVTFLDTITLRDGADLTIRGAESVVLLGGIRFVGASAGQSEFVVESLDSSSSTRLESLLGLWATSTDAGMQLDSNAFSIDGMQRFEMTANASATGIGTIDVSSRTLKMGLPQGVVDGAITADAISIEVSSAGLDLSSLEGGGSIMLNADVIDIDAAGSIGSAGGALGLDADTVTLRSGDENDVYIALNSDESSVTLIDNVNVLSVASEGDLNISRVLDAQHLILESAW